jgi:hypothetical protein
MAREIFRGDPKKIQQRINSGECVTENLGRMQSGSINTIGNLVAATGSSGSDKNRWIKFLQMRKKNQRAHLH